MVRRVGVGVLSVGGGGGGGGGRLIGFGGGRQRGRGGGLGGDGRMRMAWKMARKSALRVAGRWVAVSGVGSGWLVSGCGRIVDISG